jgi:type I restriction enzyme R subunit
VIAQAFYGINFELFKTRLEDEQTTKEIAAKAGLGIDEIIQSIILDNGQPKVDWQNKSDLIGQMEIAIETF